MEQDYDNMLDEVYGEVKIGPYWYDTSIALQLVDPIAYRVGLSDYEDAFGEDED